MSDNLDKLKNTAAEVESSSQPFMEPKIDKKKGSPGRPKLSEEEKQQKAKERAEKQKQDASQSKKTENMSQASGQGPAFSIPSKEIMRPLVSSVSALAVEYAKDQRASMTPDEEDAFCEVGGKLLDKYAPGVFDKYGLEATALILVAMYGRRVVALKKVLELEKLKAHQQTESFKTMKPQTNDVNTVQDGLTPIITNEIPEMKPDSWQNQPSVM